MSEISDEELRLEIAKAKGWQRVINGSKMAFLPQETDFSIRNLKPIRCWEKYISAAWELVEEMANQKYDVTVSIQPGRETGCRVAPKGEFNTPNVIFQTASTAPRAICLAWLEWRKGRGEG